MGGSAAAGSVRRRRVFYNPRYDPFPPRRYRELYRREGAAQAEISGYALSQVADADGWRVTALMDGALVETRIEVLGWSDLVQVSMGAGIAATYGKLLLTVAVYLRGGVLWRLLQLRRGPVLAGFYPVAMLLAQLALAVLAGLGVAQLAGWVAGLAGMGLLLAIFRRMDHRLFAHYLMHDLAFSARGGGACPPALEARLAEFRARLWAALDEDCDEVLVVGHSSGAHLAVSVLADLLGDGLPGGGCGRAADPRAGGADGLVPAECRPAASRPAAHGNAGPRRLGRCDGPRRCLLLCAL